MTADTKIMTAEEFCAALVRPLRIDAGDGDNATWRGSVKGEFTGSSTESSIGWTTRASGGGGLSPDKGGFAAYSLPEVEKLPDREYGTIQYRMIADAAVARLMREMLRQAGATGVHIDLFEYDNLDRTFQVVFSVEPGERQEVANRFREIDRALADNHAIEKFVTTSRAIGKSKKFRANTSLDIKLDKSLGVDESLDVRVTCATTNSKLHALLAEEGFEHKDGSFTINSGREVSTDGPKNFTIPGDRLEDFWGHIATLDLAPDQPTHSRR